MAEANAVSSSSSQSNERSGRVVRTVGDSVQQQIKTSVHKELIKRVELDKLAGMQETWPRSNSYFW